MEIKPISVIKARLGIEPGGKVQRFFTNACYKHMDKYVPMDTGDLRSNVMVSTNSITYKSPYAHYMYEGKVMGPNIPIIKNGVPFPVGYYSPKGRAKKYTGANINYHTAGTGPHWDERMKSAELNDVIREVQNYVNRGA